MPGMDAPLDGYGLFPDSRILASKDVETEPGGRWNAIILLIRDDLEQLCRAIAALCGDDAELGHMPADRVRQHRSLTNQKLPLRCSIKPDCCSSDFVATNRAIDIYAVNLKN